MSAAEPAIPQEIYFEISQFLFLEARLLDEQQFEAWLELVSPEIHYRIPVMRSRYLRDGEADREIDTDHFDDDYESLGFRIQRMIRPGISSLDPRPREIRLVGNIEVSQLATPDDYEVRSVIGLTRNRLLDRSDRVSARRRDLIRREPDGTLKLVKRTAMIEQNTILMSNLSSLL